MTHYNSILLLEDDPDDRDVFQNALDQKFPVIEYVMLRDGKEGLDFLRSDIKPDIIFSDISMALVDGKQFLKEYRKGQFYAPRCPVIMMSTSRAPRDIEECIALGASYYLIKPSSYIDLINELEFILSHRWF